MIRRKKVEPVTRYPKNEKPRVIPLQSEIDQIDREKSLLGFLQKKGKLVEAGYAQMLKARSLFVFKNKSPDEVARELGVDIRIVTAWITQYGWQERRAEITFNKFCDLQEIFKKRSKSLDLRQDNIAYSLENILEEFIHDHASGDKTKRLAPKDLQTLISCLQSLQGIRRLAHDRATTKTEVNNRIEFDTGDNMIKMIASLVGSSPDGKPALLEDNEYTFTDITPATDVEFEVLDEQED